MTYLKTLSATIYAAKGVAASVLGQTYAVYRLNNTAVGSVIDSRCLAYPTFQMYSQRTTSKAIIEGQIFDLLAFISTCDGTKLRLGDILVENGFGSDGGQYAVADIRQSSPFGVVLIRVETNCSIERPHPTAGAAEDQPSSGAVYRRFADGYYGGETVADRHQVSLDSGLYTVLPQGSGTMASIPIGIQPLNRVKDSQSPNIPTTFYRTHFLAYIPPTPGYIPSELDVIKNSNADSYVISQIHISEVGLQGSICGLEKINT